VIYTVGLIDKYEAQIEAGSAVKLGAGVDEFGRPYPGGWVWRTAEEARAYLVARNSTHNRRVYGVMADWDSDTVVVAGQPTRCLKSSALVVRLPPDHKQ
jgi:hypothetical protein